MSISSSGTVKTLTHRPAEWVEKDRPGERARSTFGAVRDNVSREAVKTRPDEARSGRSKETTFFSASPRGRPARIRRRGKSRNRTHRVDLPPGARVPRHPPPRTGPSRPPVDRTESQRIISTTSHRQAVFGLERPRGESLPCARSSPSATSSEQGPPAAPGCDRTSQRPAPRGRRPSREAKVVGHTWCQWRRRKPFGAPADELAIPEGSERELASPEGSERDRCDRRCVQPHGADQGHHTQVRRM